MDRDSYESNMLKDIDKLHIEISNLKKENDELRTALVLFTEYAEVYGDQPFYEIPRVKMMIAKEVIDKKGEECTKQQKQ